MNPGSLPGALQGLALQARDLLRSLCAPALAPFLADWPDPVRSRPIPHATQAGIATPSCVLPVLGWMTDIAYDEAIFGVSVIADLRRHAQSLAWRQTYTARDLGDEFMRNYGYPEIPGPSAPLTVSST
jgi:hypothetical protein